MLWHRGRCFILHEEPILCVGNVNTAAYFFHKCFKSRRQPSTTAAALTRMVFRYRVAKCRSNTKTMSTANTRSENLDIFPLFVILTDFLFSSGRKIGWSLSVSVSGVTSDAACFYFSGAPPTPLMK